MNLAVGVGGASPNAIAKAMGTTGPAMHRCVDSRLIHAAEVESIVAAAGGTSDCAR